MLIKKVRKQGKEKLIIIPKDDLIQIGDYVFIKKIEEDNLKINN
jgi:sporulation protein YlmC with PRC-barrel domain